MPIEMCGTCMYFTDEESGLPGTADSEVNVFHLLGRCNLHDTAVRVGGWCGEHWLGEETNAG